MKTFFYPTLLACAALLVSCQSDINEPLTTETTVNFSLTIPDELASTRANASGSNSAKGGLTNVDMQQYDLRYQLAVYQIEGTDTTLVKKIVQTSDLCEDAQIALRLTPNRTYRFVAWADFVKQGETSDLHYNTEDLTRIQLLSSSATLNDESRDAFFASQEENVTASGLSQAITLKRPFAKLRIVTTDWDATTPDAMPDQVSITYYGCTRFNGINALTGNYLNSETLGSADDAATYTATIDKTTKAYEMGYDSSDANRTLLTDYLMTDVASVQTPIHAVFRAYNGTTLLNSCDFSQNVPIQRNYLTTLLGNMLSTNVTVKMSIQENFTDGYIDHESWFFDQGYTPEAPDYSGTTVAIDNAAQLMWLAAHEADVKGKTIQLTSDIDMSGVNWLPIDNNSYSFDFDGNGHTLRNFSINGAYADNVGVEPGFYYTGVFAKFRGNMRNVTFENITINGLNGANDNVQFTYFSGPIGQCIGNLTNVHARHIVCRGTNRYNDRVSRQNNGGLAGYLGNGHTVINCSAEDVQVSGIECGGLIGSLSGNCTVKDSHSEDVILRLSKNPDFELGYSAGGFVGGLPDAATVTFDNCTPPTRVAYIDDTTGQPRTDYAEENPLYGKSRKGTTPTIK